MSFTNTPLSAAPIRARTTGHAVSGAREAFLGRARLELLPDRRIRRIRLGGPLDAAGVEAVEARFYAATATWTGDAVVDLSRVSRVTSLAVRMLVIAAERMALSGRTLVILRPRLLVDESLRAAGLYRLAPVAYREEEIGPGLDGPVPGPPRNPFARCRDLPGRSSGGAAGS